MRELFKKYLSEVPAGKVLDIGSQMVVGQAFSYRSLFEDAGWEYSGLDLAEGVNVDILTDSTEALPISDESFDVIISGQAFEHIDFFWVTFKEMARVLKPVGMIFLIAPSRGPEHRYPVDCWRFYPDGFHALAKWAGVELISAETDWQPDEDKDSAPWGDTVGVFRKLEEENSSCVIESNPEDAHRLSGPDGCEHVMCKAIASCLDSRNDHTSAWQGHYLFAHWLVNAVKPSLIVELGTHYGGSYFGFCEAVKHSGLSCQCYAIDTWIGDEQAGYYGRQVFEYVASVNNSKFNDFSKLYKMDFNTALSLFEEGRIDILHIDGCHSYEAVRHDYESWLPKMSDNGIILFHDINERQDDFGVWRLWEELSEKHRGFAFDHSHGLGVLAVGSVTSAELHELIEAAQSPEKAQVIKRYFSSLNQLLISKSSKELQAYPAQIFIDSGNGFSEEESLTQSVFLNSNRINFDLGSIPVKRLRFDPCNLPCIVNLKSTKVDYLNGSVGQISPAASNALEHVERTFFFSTDDPQIIFDVNKTISSVSFELRVSPVFEETARQILTRGESLEGMSKETSDGLNELRELFAIQQNELIEAQGQLDFVNSEFVETREALDLAFVEYDELQIKCDEALRTKLRLEILQSDLESMHSSNETLKSQLAEEVRQKNVSRSSLLRLVNKSSWAEHIEGVLSRLMHPVAFWRHWRKGDYKVISESGLFDEKWYLETYPDVAAVGCDPIEHYVRWGALEGRWPNAHFDACWYATKYKSVLRFGLLPFVHYILYGQKRQLHMSDPGVDGYRDWRTLRKRFLKEEFNVHTFLVSLEKQPIISIIMPLYNTPEPYLKEALQSVKEQLYPHWELCLVDDASTDELASIIKEIFGSNSQVRYIKRNDNGGISAASNDALNMATGEYVCFLDHDDVLEPHAIASMVLGINQNPEVDWLYSDEDKISERGHIFAPVFKPDWSPAFFMCCMFTCHFSMYKIDLLREIGGFDSAFDGAQDYEMSLRLLRTNPIIVHIPDVLYHWRMCEGSTALNVDSKPKAIRRQQRALTEFLADRDGYILDGPIHGMNKIQFKMKNSPRIGIVIPSAGRESHVFVGTSYVEHLVESIQTKSTYKNYSIYISVNEDLEAMTRESLERLDCILVNYSAEPFNLSDKINELVESCQEEHVVLLNDDMEIISEDWLEQMLMWFEQDNVGCVGSQLLFPDNTIQHAGVVFFDIGPGHPYYSEPNTNSGYLGSIQYAREYSAVTGACMMFKRSEFLEVGGFDPDFHMNYNDVDFCWKLRIQLGKRIVYTPEAKLFHYESVSKGETSPKELEAINEKWIGTFNNDPFFNRHLQPGSFAARLDSQTPLEEYYSTIKR